MGVNITPPGKATKIVDLVGRVWVIFIFISLSFIFAVFSALFILDQRNAAAQSTEFLNFIAEAQLPILSVELNDQAYEKMSLRLRLFLANQVKGEIRIDVMDVNDGLIFSAPESLADVDFKKVSSEWNVVAYPITDGANTLGSVRFLGKISTDSQVALKNGLYVILIASLVGFLIVFFVVKRLVAHRFVRPLEKIVAKLPTVRSSSPQPFESGVFEIQSLWEELKKTSGEIAKHVQREEQLTSQMAMDKKMFTLARQVAHDIRSPLAALELVASKNSYSPADKEILMKGAIGRIREIANDLLGKSRASVNSEDSENGKFARGEPLSQTLNALIMEKSAEYSERSDISFELNLSAEASSVTPDIKPIDLYRVMSNLINNAVEASPQGGVIVLSAINLNGGVQVSLQDSGTGISDSIINKLGKETLSTKIKSPSAGNGLGLVHASETVRLHGGTLDIESAMGKGTIIKVTLPVE